MPTDGGSGCARHERTPRCRLPQQRGRRRRSLPGRRAPRGHGTARDPDRLEGSMPGWEPTVMRKPYRVMVAGAALETFFAASEEEKSERAIPRFKQILAEWEELGARVVASMCDDVFQVGPTEPPRWAWYLLFD